MPHLRIETSVPQHKIPKDLHQKLCDILAKSLGKPPTYCAVTIIGGVSMSWGGKEVPMAQTTLMSIGSLGVEQNKKHSKAIFEAVCKALEIPNDRMYITFIDSSSADVGYQGTTFHDIFGA